MQCLRDPTGAVRAPAILRRNGGEAVSTRRIGASRCGRSGREVAGKTPLKADVARERTTSLLFLRVVDEPSRLSATDAGRSSDRQKRQRGEGAGLVILPKEGGRGPLRSSQLRTQKKIGMWRRSVKGIQSRHPDAGFVVTESCSSRAGVSRRSRRNCWQSTTADDRQSVSGVTATSAKLIVGSLSCPHGARLVIISRYSRAEE